MITEAGGNKWLIRLEVADDWGGLFTLGAFTGLRLGDLLRLERKHVKGDSLKLLPKKTSRKAKPKQITVPLAPPCVAWMYAY